MPYKTHNPEYIKKILKALSRDARQNNNQISQETGIHKNTVKNIMQTLQDEQIIWGYQPVINYEKLGYHGFLFLIKNKKTYTHNFIDKYYEKGKQLSKQLQKQHDCIILHSGFTHGRYDSYIYFVATNLKTALRCISVFIETFNESIEEYDLLEELHLIRMSGVLNPASYTKEEG